jgi:hypothetical protein
LRILLLRFGALSACPAIWEIRMLRKNNLGFCRTLVSRGATEVTSKPTFGRLAAYQHERKTSNSFGGAVQPGRFVNRR